MTCSATRTFMLSLRNGIIVLNSECLDIISSSVGNLSPSYFLQISSSSSSSALPSKATENASFGIPLTENKASSHDTIFSSGYIRNHIGNLYLFNRIHPFLSSLYISKICQVLKDIPRFSLETEDISYSFIAFFKAVSPWLVSLSIVAASLFPFFA